MRYPAQVAAYLLFAAALGYLSSSPSYTYLEPGKSLIRMNFSHAGETKQACRKFTQAELDQLAPNMRKPMDCPRERVALAVEVEIDGTLYFKKTIPPTGVAGDGAATVNEKFEVSAGRHAIAVRMRDTRGGEGFDYVRQDVVDIGPGRVLVIDFEPETGGFKFL